MLLEGKNIIVEELCDDIVCDGIVTRYDPDSPYMFCKILLISEEAQKDLGIINFKEENILVIKRYAKEEFIDKTYFIDSKDVRAVIDNDTYNKILKEGLEWIKN